MRLAALFAAGVVALVTAIALWDEPQPDLTDLAPRPRTVPDAENARVAIRSLAIQRAADTKNDTYQTALDTLTEAPDGWDPVAADIVVNTRADLWPLIDQALRMPRSEEPIPASAKTLIDDHVGDRLALFRAATIRARWTARTSSSNEGLDQAVALVEASFRASNSGGVLVEQLSALAIRGLALRAIRSILDESRPDDAAHANALRRIQASRPSPDAMAESYRTEFVGFQQLLGVYTAGRFKNPFGRLDGDAPYAAAFFFKHHQTLGLAAQEMRATLALIGQPFSRVKTSQQSQAYRSALVWRIPNPDNAMGRYLIELISPVYRGVLRSWVRDQTNLSATEALLAVRIYQRAHDNALPPTLDALVPDYLPAVPRDYFDGQPIRYSRDLGVIWSVGENNLAITSADQPLSERDIIIHLSPRTKPEHPALFETRTGPVE